MPESMGYFRHRLLPFCDQPIDAAHNEEGGESGGSKTLLAPLSGRHRLNDGIHVEPVGSEGIEVRGKHSVISAHPPPQGR